MIYPTQAAAFARAEQLARLAGVWPAVVRCEGGWRLTVDPPDVRSARQEQVGRV